MSTQTSASEGSAGTPPAISLLQDKCSSAGISKPQMNRMIMDCLVKAGYSQAATDFAKEAGITLGVDMNTIEQRKKIKNAIYAGKLQTAIEEINDIDSAILEHDKNLHFQLLNLQLVELIKEENAKSNGDIHKCVNFAQDYLAPRAPTDPLWKDQLEKTMALLVFDHKTLVPELNAVISPDLRVKVAGAANEAVLRATGEAPIAGIVELLQTRVYAETEARNLKRWPANGMSIGLDAASQTSTNAPNRDNHAEDDQMVD